MQLLDDVCQLSTRRREVVHYMPHRAGTFLPGDQAVIEQFTEPLGEYFGRDARNVAFQLPRATYSALQGPDDRGGPFATHDVLESLIRGTLIERELFGGHLAEHAAVSRRRRVGTNR